MAAIADLREQLTESEMRAEACAEDLAKSEGRRVALTEELRSLRAVGCEVVEHGLAFSEVIGSMRAPYLPCTSPVPAPYLPFSEVIDA